MSLKDDIDKFTSPNTIIGLGIASALIFVTTDKTQRVSKTLIFLLFLLIFILIYLLFRWFFIHRKKTEKYRLNQSFKALFTGKGKVDHQLLAKFTLEEAERQEKEKKLKKQKSYKP